MPSVKITPLIEMLNKAVEELKAGDPSWTPAQKKRAKDAVEVFKAFSLVSRQQCSDIIQTIPPPPEPGDAPVRVKRIANVGKSRKR